jgi:hypothetical protein
MTPEELAKKYPTEILEIALEIKEEMEDKFCNQFKILKGIDKIKVKVIKNANKQRS